MDMPWLAPPAVLGHGLFSTWAAGSILMRTGERIPHVDVLLEGAVDEIAGGLVVRHDQPGTLLGALGAAQGNLAASTLRSRTRTVVMTVSVAGFRLVATSPETERWVADQLDERARAFTRAAGRS